MNYSFEYIDIILLAMIAGFIFLRLRGILGKRTNFNEKLSADFKQEFQKETIKKNLENQTFDDSAKQKFLNGAKEAYEMIVTSFAKGDKNVLKPLLNKEIYQNFSDEIDNRKKENIKSELTFVGVKSAKIKNFEKKDNIYTFTVDFVSEIIACKKDKNNKVIEGNPDIIKTVNDVWKFSKNMWSNNPNWYLVETQA
jgi:predicted lipid-binding transport protein (Tim44 family)